MRDRQIWYRLDGHVAVPCDLQGYAAWRAAHRMPHVVAHDIVGDAEVSTVFLGIDHSRGDGAPIVFETMIFGGEHDRYQKRYSTWEEAEAGHKQALAMVLAG